MKMKRVGPHPHALGNNTMSIGGCPDVFELETGDFAVIGRVIDQQADVKDYPVEVDRHVLVGAGRELPEAVVSPVLGTAAVVTELENNHFQVKGRLSTSGLIDFIPTDAGVSEDEEIIVIDRDSMLASKSIIPAK